MFEYYKKNITEPIFKIALNINILKAAPCFYLSMNECRSKNPRSNC